VKAGKQSAWLVFIYVSRQLLDGILWLMKSPRETHSLGSCAEQDCSGAEGEMGKGEGGEPACLTDFHFSSPVDSLTGFYGRCVAFGHRPIEPRRIAKRSVLAEISKGTGFDSKVGTMRNERSLSSAEEDCSGAEGEMRSRSVNPILPMHGFLGFAKDRITSGLPTTREAVCL
jgi:hypothetical protein